MSSFDGPIDDFLSRVGVSIFGFQNLSRVWQAFMAYCMCLCAQSFQAHSFIVTPQNAGTGFLFKCFPAGNPNNYSWFEAHDGNRRYEIRLNLDSQNLRFQSNSLKLNLDVAIILSNSINSNGLVDSSRDLVTFCECKNQNAFPELIAGFEGCVLELQGDRLFGRWPLNSIPCCL